MENFYPFVVLKCRECGTEIPQKESHSAMLKEAIRRGWVLRGHYYYCEKCKKFPKE